MTASDRLGAELLVYVVGNPQAEHFAMVFATARLAGWLPESSQAVHVGFGNVLGTDGKMFRTRQGGTVKLNELLDEAVDRARDVIAARDEEMGKLPPDELTIAAEAVGIGAVKYADLSTDRTRDYRFDWDRMLSFDGNTGPYLQYAHARICSIFRRAKEAGVAPEESGVVLAVNEHEERELAKRLLGFADAVRPSVETYSPHKLCGHLFELASAFTGFYEQCPVLRARILKRGRRGWRCAASPRMCWKWASSCSLSRRPSGCELFHRQTQLVLSTGRQGSRFPSTRTVWRRPSPVLR